MPSLPTFLRRPLIQTVPLPYLIVTPVLLAIATLITLFVHADTNAAMLWSQCHAHARIPALSRFPGFGTPMCYLVSFFREALAAVRSTVVIGVVLAFVSGLLTVSMVEAARVCNAPNVLIAYPTGPWLVFNLVGGAVVWELVIIPAFLHQARTAYLVRKASNDEAASDGDGAPKADDDRHLPDSEVMAIPLSVAFGFVLPSILMLALPSAATIGVWLFFPVYVSALRQLVRRLVHFTRRSEPTHLHLESHWLYLLGVYAVPLVCSLVAHILVIWHLAAKKDDRQEMTRSTVRFVEIDAQFIGWTVLYWMLVEVGWKVPVVMIVTSVVVGPGSGICMGWLYREKLIHQGSEEHVETPTDEERAADEQTPLLT